MNVTCLSTVDATSYCFFHLTWTDGAIRDSWLIFMINSRIKLPFRAFSPFYWTSGGNGSKSILDLGGGLVGGATEKGLTILFLCLPSILPLNLFSTLEMREGVRSQFAFFVSNKKNKNFLFYFHVNIYSNQSILKFSIFFPKISVPFSFFLLDNLPYSLNIIEQMILLPLTLFST